jgi:NhaP-type Na+/H+ or K+/H+ antiporter
LKVTEPPRNERDLFKIIVVGTAISFGILAAIMVSMKGFFGGNISFEFSLKSLIAFLVGCAAGWLFWWVVKRMMGRPR